MLGFLTPQGKDAADPMPNAKSAAAWLRQLPALDVIGRQQQVTHALDAMRKAQPVFDASRIAAIQFVDAALGADRRQLIKQYIENAENSPKLAERIWQSLWELSQAFMLAYQAALESALRQTPNARWKSMLPLLFVRLVHFHGTDAKLRVFKYERWIPAEVDGAAPDLSAFLRARLRPRGGHVACRGSAARSRGRSSRNTCMCCSCISSIRATWRPQKSIGQALSCAHGAAA